MKVGAMQSDWVGRVIDGRFTLSKWLGGAGNTGVFLAERPGTPSQKTAIKLVPAEAETQENPANFKLRAELTHRHLIKIFESGTTEIDGTRFFYVVSEYADEILADLLPNRAMTTEEVKEMLLPILDALGYLHGKRLVHSRLKPSNILVVNDVLKLTTDCVRPASESDHDKSELTVYDAPERTQGILTRSCDLWSLGVILVEAFTQKPPEWTRSSNRSPQVPESIPQPYRKIAELCLRIDTGERATINEVKRHLGIPVVPLKPFQSNPQSAPPPEARLPYAPPAQTRSYPAPFATPMEQTEVPRLAATERNFSHKPRAGVVTLVLLLMVIAAGLLWMRAHGGLSMPQLPSARSNDQPPAQSSEPQHSASAPEQPPAQSSEPQPSASAPERPPAQTAPAPAQEQQDNPSPQPKPQTANPPQPAPPRTFGGNINSVGFATQRVMPRVLPSASQTIHGRVNVFVRVNVTANGDVSYASLEDAGPSRYFSKIAMDAARQWKFRPAFSGGRPVPSTWTLHFGFMRDRTDVNAVPSAP